MSEMLADSAVLYYKEGGSDKVYQVQLDPAKVTNEWVVNFQYGRRGSTLTTGTKTPVSVDYEKALKIFRMAVTQKKAKGYTEDTSGRVFAMSHNEENNTGIVPQLLNNIEESDINTYIADPAYMMQQKFDGKRMMIRKIGRKVEAINRRGLTCGFPDVVKTAFLEERDFGDFLIDGEMVGEVYYAFDLLEINDPVLQGRDARELDAVVRYELLHEHFGDLGVDEIQVVPNALTPAAKRKLFDKVKAERFEGVVFKRKDRPYKPGRPNKLGDQLKFKFVDTADVIVTSVNDKRSVGMSVYPDGRKSDQSLVFIGNCTIPPNYDIPKEGDVIEVRYLYAYPDGALYQPVYQGKRTDKGPKDCKINHLKYKAGTEE